jgi:ABC-type transport system involved in multi-copper enzyme maturation permease subunit
MNSIVKFTILTAIRDWLYIGTFVLAMLAIALSIFLGGTALSEQGFMSTAYIGGASRMILMVGLILFVCFHVRRSFDNKEIELILTKPITRINFIIAYFAGFAMLAFTLVLPFFFVFFILGKIGYIWAHTLGTFLWCWSMFYEALIVMAFAFFCSLILRSAVTAVMSSFAFYFLCRIFGFFLISIHNPASLSHGTLTGRVSEGLLSVIGIFLPRLDMFAKSEWLVYGVENYDQYLLFLASSFVYIPFLVAIGAFDFVRKQF